MSERGDVVGDSVDAGAGRTEAEPRAYEPAPSVKKLLLFVLAFVVFAVIVVGGGVILVGTG